MANSATSESVHRALARARWLHGLLIVLVVFLAAATLQNGGRLDEMKREIAKSKRIQLIEEARVLRMNGEEGWFTSARERLELARRIRADSALREAWLDCLVAFPSRSADQPVPFRSLPFPAGLNRAPISFGFSSDSRRVNGFVDGRAVVWILDEMYRPPKVLPGPVQGPEPLNTSRTADSSLLVTIGDGGRLEIQDALSRKPVIQLRGRNPIRIEALAWSPDGKWIVDAGWLIAGSGPDQRIVELWNIPALRNGFGMLNLDWNDANPSAPPVTPRDPRSWIQPMKVALGGLTVIAVAAAVITNQHLIYRRYQAAERAAASRAAELDQARERMAYAEKMRALGTLAAGVAHDFNNLLSVIQMSRQLIERSAPAGGAAREHLGNIAQAVDQGRTVVRSILGYSRETVHVAPQVRITDVVGETLTLLRRQFLGGLEIIVDLDEELPPLDISRGRLEQILLNLLVNASEAMSGRGSLWIRGAMVSALSDCVLTPAGPGPWMDLVVADSGPGITPDVLPRIFEPFFTTKNLGNQRGTGLGLATVWRIASEEGVGIGVRTNPGSGSEFHIYISTSQTPANPDPGKT